MTATSDLIADLIEGRTYQVGVSSEPTGLRWTAFVYGRIGEGAAVLGLPADMPVWNEVATRHTPALAADEYRTSALEWLAQLTGRHAEGVDCVLVLPGGVERVRG